MYSVEEKVRWFAVSSRIFIFFLQCIANYFITDHEPGVFEKPLAHQDKSVYVAILDFFTDGLTRWDGQYFLHVAEYGYTYENTLAFFPLFPLLTRFFGFAFQFFANNIFYATGVPFILSRHHTLVLMALLINNVLFVHSALILYKLTLKIFESERFAYATALLFCMNPASIFFSAAYSETLFFFLTLNAMINIEYGHLLAGSILCGLSSMTRANGITNAGYIVYRIIKNRHNSLSFILTLIVSFCCLFISFFPFVLHQFYCYTKFCVIEDTKLQNFIIHHAQNNDYVLPGNKSTWCDDFLPFAYRYVQNHYWNVGFLNYYETKQLPNFALAAPVLLLTAFGVKSFVSTHKFNLLYLGLIPGASGAIIPSSCFPYVMHLLFLALFGALCMHVQVCTRFIFSSSPAIYWFAAQWLTVGMCESKECAAFKKVSKSLTGFYECERNKKSKWNTLILSERFIKSGLIVRYYFFAYFLAGAVIFSNNLPWT